MLICADWADGHKKRCDKMPAKIGEALKVGSVIVPPGKVNAIWQSTGGSTEEMHAVVIGDSRSAKLAFLAAKRGSRITEKQITDNQLKQGHLLRITDASEIQTSDEL